MSASADDGWTTVAGASGGKRNGRAKFQAAVGGVGGGGGRTGPPVNLRQKLLDIAAESAWFNSRPQNARDAIVSEIVRVVERQADDMSRTPFFARLLAMLQESRQAMNDNDEQQSTVNADAPSAAHTSSASFDIVIYGIGRYAEWSLGRAAEDLVAEDVTPALVRGALRSTSRGPQLQLACILAVARANAGAVTTPHDAAASAASESSAAGCAQAAVPAASAARESRLYVFDPMLSDLEKAVATSLGIAVIAENEEGKREADGPTLFFMPHCPQVRRDQTRQGAQRASPARLSHASARVFL